MILLAFYIPMKIDRSTLAIYFGDSQDQLYPDNYLSLNVQPTIVDTQPFAAHAQRMSLQSLLFLRQTHGAAGVSVHSHDPQASFARDGDYLITHLAHAGLGVMTADCLPIIMYDPQHHAVALVHAGWRGTVQEIARHALTSLQDNYGTQPSNVQVIFGPSARSCCYSVSPDFAHHIPPQFHEHVLVHKNDLLLFDLPKLNQLQLEDAGVRPTNIDYSANACTIGDKRFFSYRRDKEKAGRQMTIVSLHKQV